MESRIPTYLQHERFGLSPREVVNVGLHCQPEQIQERVIVLPWWQAALFSGVAERIEPVVEGTVYELGYQGQTFTLVRSGIGAPQTGDIVLALGCTNCQTIIFSGSVGGLDAAMRIGDLVIAEESLAGDGFSRYLSKEAAPPDGFAQCARPDGALTATLTARATAISQEQGVALHRGRIFAVDSILAQFHHLDYITGELRCNGIEMETAALFAAARLVGIRAAALLQVSDLPLAGKTLISGRSAEERERRHRIRREVLTRVIAETLAGC
jgi:purine-nucleoside phosphorylase